MNYLKMLLEQGLHLSLEDIKALSKLEESDYTRVCEFNYKMR